MSEHVQIAIVGSGFSGLGAAIRLKQAGFHDFAVFERADELGGTWRDNTYPGCACDVESNLYSFSFAPNPEWTRRFSPQAEILAYLRRCARDFDVLPHVRFRHELEQAAWDESAQRWRLRTSEGAFTANVLIAGMGPFAEPKLPEIPGLSRFGGKLFHSARWDHSYDLTDKRVAVVGTGASAVQFVPAIQSKVRSLTLFQRTPAWVIPRMDRATEERTRHLFRALPLAQKLARLLVYARREAYVLLFRNPAAAKLIERLALRYLEREIKDPELRQKLMPNFRMGCKRVLLSSDYLPSLTRENVQVITSGIRELREHHVITEDGKSHEVDAIILGTGFHVTDMPFAKLVRGRAGKSLHEVWQGSPKAHFGTTVSGFPNLFLLLGPNTGLGHTSVVFMVESQLELVLGALEHMRAQGLASLEPKPEVQARFVAEVAQKSRGTVWTDGGCRSWYFDETGRNSSLWPGFTFSFRRRARFCPHEYLRERPRLVAEPSPSLLAEPAE
jgi:cation diffusion facilitator CzcD-associated flavoprotein CzcO